jgi:peptidoglycan/LPS O-acetylase OafA/YrhL
VARVRLSSRGAGSDLAYRRDLDGLRGIAVAAVVAYHLGFPFASGGFVGVDIFFVLSGYLITRIIASELETGKFSIASFYERRIRRIVPALVLVCAATSILAVAFLLPGELRRFAASLVAVAFSVSNVWCYRISGYFGPAAEMQPLLHTWSLGIEEQFYLLFPLFLSAISMWHARRRAVIVWTLFVLSLGISIVMLERRPESTFFLLHTRAWELLTGSIVALGFIPVIASRAKREAGGIAGLVAIFAAITIYTSKTPFPGLAALLPCVGTGLVIWSGETQSFASRLLSVRPLVLLGLISYSLYLWHWPLIVFARLRDYPIENLGVRVALLALSLALAALTWRFVEQPFRRRRAAAVTRRGIYLAGGSALATLAVAGAGLLVFKGLPQRYSDQVVALEAGASDASPLRRKCHVPAYNMTYDQTCVLGADVLPQIIVLGDSHGAELSAVLGEAAKSHGASIRELTASGCPPAGEFSALRDPRCSHHNEVTLRRLTSIPPATVIVAARSVNWVRSFPEYWQGFRETVSALRAAGHRVILFGPVPDIPSKQPAPESLARWVARGNAPEDYVFRPDMNELRSVESVLREIAAETGSTFIPVSFMFCSEDSCRPYLGGTDLYFDDNHLSMRGVDILVQKLLVPVLWPEQKSKVLAGVQAGP